jgi:hypothetical protein
MSIPKLDAATEVTIAQWFVGDLEAYLKSDVMYWPITPTNPLGDKMPQLTIGGLLESFARATAALDDLSSDQRSILQAARAGHDRIVAAHRAAYINKAAREINSRLDAWSAYLDDAARKPSEVAAYYPHEVRSRAKVYLLAQTLGQELPSAAQQRMTALDTRLYAMFVPGAFVWDQRLQNMFPKDRCWWLYGQLPQ